VPQLGSRPGADAFKCMGQENPCAHQTQNCRDCLEHRKIPFAPLGSANDGRPRTVKKIPWADSKSALTEDLMQQIGPGRAHETRICPAKTRIGGGNH
jgi:hypothetical protein